MLKQFGAVMDVIARWFDEVAKVLLLAILVLINVEIIVRYLFRSSTLISDELSGYMLCWMTLLSFLHAARKDYFIRVQFATNAMSPRWRNYSAIVAALCGLFVSVVICYATVRMVDNAWRFHSVSNQYLAAPLYIPAAIMPLAYGLLALSFLEEILRRIFRPRLDEPEHSIVEGLERS